MPPGNRAVFAVTLVLASLAAPATLASTARIAPAASRLESPGPRCGGTLWRLETLSDPLRRSVNLRGKASSIATIAGLTPPGRIGPVRNTAFQRQVWRMHAVVDRYRIASNGEIVLVLFDIESALYMNAYLPSPSCLAQQARDRTGMIAARRELTSHCPVAQAAWQLLGASVEIAGVGFWNPVRSTRGALRNGAELRPLTNLKITAGCGVG
jgi:hypothetical protein